MPDFLQIKIVLPTKVYSGDFSLQNGEIRALYFGPSHTQDGIFVFFPQDEILYGGCILKQGLGNMAFANWKEYPKTLRKLKAAQLPIKLILAGHGEARQNPQLIDAVLAELERS